MWSCIINCGVSGRSVYLIVALCVHCCQVMLTKSILVCRFSLIEYSDDDLLLLYNDFSCHQSLFPFNYVPSTENHKQLKLVKRVKFADMVGLPLASVHQLTADDPFETEGQIVPHTLESRCKNLKVSPESSHNFRTALPNFSLKLNFPLPKDHPNFYSRLLSQSVSLEDTAIESNNIRGTIRVVNMEYHKEVTVRWTNNDWSTFRDSKCTYCRGSDDGQTDLFSFTLPFKNHDTIKFAVSYKVQRMEFWDNNYGKNYVLTIYETHKI